MTCFWCGKLRDQHLTARPAGAPVPRMPCTGLKAYYLEGEPVRASSRPPAAPPMVVPSTRRSQASVVERQAEHSSEAHE